MTNVEFDLSADDAQPAQRLAALLLSFAVTDRAERLEISLEDISSKTGLRFTMSAGGAPQEYSSAPGHLFTSLSVILCNFAGVAYYSTGWTEGTIETRSPRSTWRLQSDDLRRSLVLLRVFPPPSPVIHRYKVMVRGENLLTEVQGVRQKLGFYTNVFVEAFTPAEAEGRAIEIVREDTDLAEVRLNTKDDPLTLSAEESHEIESFAAHKSPREDIIFYPPKDS